MKTESDPTVLFHRKPRMMSIVLNRPRVLNSLSIEMIRAIQKALDEVEVSQRCRFLLLYGAGSRGFCAGGDIKALARLFIVCDWRVDCLACREKYQYILRCRYETGFVAKSAP